MGDGGVHDGNRWMLASVVSVKERLWHIYVMRGYKKALELPEDVSI